MSSRTEQQLQQQQHQDAGDTVRRSSLVVNLSTTRRRSLVTRLLTSSRTSKSQTSGSYFTFGPSACATGQSGSSSFPRTDSSLGTGRRVLYTCSSGKHPSSQSAPPTLSQPSFSKEEEEEQEREEAEQQVAKGNWLRSANPISPIIPHKLFSRCLFPNQSTTMNNNILQVTELTDPTESASVDNRALEPEPIVEVRHTSSSSSSSGSSAGARTPQDSADSSCGEEEAGGEKHRRRTVSRFHKTCNKQPPELYTNSSADKQEIQFRTRQLSNYSGQQQAASSDTCSRHSSSTATSKIAKCTSITTNHHRKLLTTHRQLVSTALGSTSSSSRSNTLSRLAVTGESMLPREEQVTVVASNLIEPVERATGQQLVEEESSNRRRIKVEEEEESSVSRHSRFSSRFGLSESGAHVGGHHLTTSSSTTSSSEANHHHKSLLSRRLDSGLSTAAESVHFESANSKSSSTISSKQLLSSSRFYDGNNSPDMRSLVDEIVVDFAELENCAALSSASSNSLSRVNSLSSRFFTRRPLLSPARNLEVRSALGSSNKEDVLSNEDRIDKLLRKVKSGQGDSATDLEEKEPAPTTYSPHPAFSKREQVQSVVVENESSKPASVASKQQVKAVLNESIDRIDQRMGDLCKKLQECQDSQKAVQLLKIMIQMIEKAWSVPVCGDDLGFKLCNSLRIAGGLDIILNIIEDAGCDATVAQKKPLRLNLSKISGLNPAQSEPGSAVSLGGSKPIHKDSDSDLLTSDLGQDSTSIESLSCPPNEAPIEPIKEAAEVKPEEVQQQVSDEAANDLIVKDELVFLSARLLSQCLTSENRNYIGEDGLQSVVRIACKFISMKSKQSKRILSRSSVVRQSSHAKPDTMNQELRKKTAATTSSATDQPSDSLSALPGQPSSEVLAAVTMDTAETQDLVQEPANEVHATIGAEILQHLFKHSEATCAKIIDSAGLEAILYGCRSSELETLRRCASALANLALYAGPEGQQAMIREKAHVWLFPLAFHEDDNIQYYACLAIVVLAANLEIEADVQKSSTLDLVEPFVTSHDPQKFAESTTSHIHGQSDQWLRRLLPLLESRRVEARNLACFHLAMEAYIKREQGQTQVFSAIGALEPLRKVAGSPFAIASKFACQALRLIGEKEPHRLTQQVPLWTSDDVGEWVRQIGFERFRGSFIESKVDGDLLLQLDDEMLLDDIGIDNGIIRRRFLRELSQLKAMADYSSVDRTNLAALLQSTGKEFVQYIYPMLQIGITRHNIHLLDIEHLLRECKVSNPIHRIKLTHAIKTFHDKIGSDEESESDKTEGNDPDKNLDVFVSYRRATGSQLASLLKVHLQLRGFSVFIDVEKLEAGKFDNNLLHSIKAARNFILVLSPTALDRCIGDFECKDWVHKEIVAAMASNCNIIPIMDNFQWPESELLPEDMRSISYFNGVRWIHDYQDACVDKIERFIRGEFNNRASSFAAIGGIQQVVTGGGGGGSQRAQSAASNYSSTPSIIATPSVTGFPAASSIYSTPTTDSYHPLAFASHYQTTNKQHSQLSNNQATNSKPPRSLAN